VAALSVILAAAALADWVAPAPYGRQFRDASNSPASRRFLMGTDELGRDRLSRLLHGSRVSLLLAPGASLVSTLLAGFVGAGAGYLGGRWDRLASRVIALFLSLPWLLLLLAARATLPLHASGAASAGIVFALLGLLGWAAPARAMRAEAQSLRGASFVLQARASGSRGLRLLLVHVLPNLAPALRAQFWILVPIFILSEATLGLLGLGVAEPLPSWGNLLRGSDPVAVAPALLMFVVLGCLHLIFPGREFTT
jgi:peptide/nickel transport system permease protein